MLHLFLIDRFNCNAQILLFVYGNTIPIHSSHYSRIQVPIIAMHQALSPPFCEVTPSPIDTTDKAMYWEGGKQLATEKLAYIIN